MNVSEAVERRISVRAFKSDPVPGEMVHDLLVRSARAPSGGNLQPWRVHAVAGAPLKELLGLVKTNGPDSAPGYAVYPENLWEPYRTRRFQAGEDMYGTIPIAREDKPARLRQFARNLELFGAPVGVFVTVERKMGYPQWGDLGMYLQTLMLLAVERGLDTCPQEYWVVYSKTVEQFLGVPEDQMLYCGMALGYRDEDAAINRLRTRRDAFEHWGEMRGF